MKCIIGGAEVMYGYSQSHDLYLSLLYLLILIALGYVIEQAFN